MNAKTVARIRAANKRTRARLIARIGVATAALVPYRAIVEPLAHGCPRCGRGITVVPWNQQVLWTTCNNLECPLYHKRIGLLRISDIPG